MHYTLELRWAVLGCECPEHGMKAVRVPCAEPGCCFTVQFKAFALAIIAASRSLTQAAELLRLHWQNVQRLMDRAVTRGLGRRSTGWAPAVRAGWRRFSSVASGTCR